MRLAVFGSDKSILYINIGVFEVRSINSTLLAFSYNDMDYKYGPTNIFGKLGIIYTIILVTFTKSDKLHISVTHYLDV